MKLRTLSVMAALFLVAGFAQIARAADSFNVDPVHSTLMFRIRHLNVSNFYGRFNAPTGKFTIDADDLTKSTFNVEVKAENVDSGNPQRDTHLKSPDFFNAGEFPTLSFKSTAVKKTGDNMMEVTGDLTIHGVTKSVTVPIQYLGSGPGMKTETRGGFEAIFDVKRSDFGMNWNPKVLGDDVRIFIGIEGVKE